MSDNEASQHGTTARHERPFLFTWNRRLRHLHGVSLRNLNTVLESGRIRAKTITDDDAPYNLETPTKRALRSEKRGIPHAQSFTSLANAKQAGPKTPQKPANDSGLDGISSLRPGTLRLRRRSTLHWSSASPRVRQQKLEDLTVHRMVDAWFSVHSKNSQILEPIYVSEVMERSMNPTFAFFDLDHCDPIVTRADDCILKVWTRDGTAEEYFNLIELDINLRSLQFIGRALDTFHHPLPQNCVLLHLSDGIYTSFTDLPASYTDNRMWERKDSSPVPGSTFDSLMQLANLDDCVQDALKIRVQLEQDVDQILVQDHPHRAYRQSLVIEREQHSAAYNAVLSMRRQRAQLDRRKDDIRKALHDRRQATTRTFSTDPRLNEQSNAIQRDLMTGRDIDHRLMEQATGQMRRIGEDLLTIFPIEALRGKALQFAICNLHLPNSTFDDTNRDEIAAAMGFTAQLVHQLSLYLATSLPYPLEANASNSFVFDPISINLPQRRYPIHPTNVDYKFEYGVFLLNKDIEFLMNKVNLRVLDLRHTLPNLKYLLYILTAGQGELPARKAGGIRGLLGGRLTPSVSRRTSEESIPGSKEMQKRIDSGPQSIVSKGTHALAEEKTGEIPDSLSPSPKRSGSLPFRQSGLRNASQ